jgi:hypothetical protein
VGEDDRFPDRGFRLAVQQMGLRGITFDLIWDEVSGPVVPEMTLDTPLESMGEVKSTPRSLPRYTSRPFAPGKELDAFQKALLDYRQQLGVDFKQMTGKHVGQNPGGPIWELPASLHLNTPELHPLGNVAGVGLTEEERAAFDVWRNSYWQARASYELQLRGFL